MGSREAYLEQRVKELKQLASRVEELNLMAALAKVEARIAHDKQVELLAAQLDVVRQRLQELAAAGDETWAERQRALEGAWTELKGSLGRAAARLK